MLTDVSPYPAFAQVIECSAMGPWKYMVGTATGDSISVSIVDVQAGEASTPVQLQGEALRIHCTATRCYGIDLDGSKMVSFDPTDGSVTVAFEYTGWVGVQGEASFDRDGLVLYVSLVNGTGVGVPVSQLHHARRH
jgi:hypothetical protein